MALIDKLSAIGDAIRAKTGKNDPMTLDEMPVEIANIQSGSSGGVETCTVSVVLPAKVAIFAWGNFTRILSGQATPIALPSTAGISHLLPIETTYLLENIPVGSAFTFYCANGIKSASVTGDIEFSLANHDSQFSVTCLFAMCRCNGDGTITIKV